VTESPVKRVFLVKDNANADHTKFEKGNKQLLRDFVVNLEKVLYYSLEQTASKTPLKMNKGA